MIRFLTLFMGVASLAAPLLADQCPGQTQILHCDVSARKSLTVCIGGGTAKYSFGPAGAPELVLNEPLSKVNGVAWPGIGRTIWEEIRFSNKDVVYTVWSSYDRLAQSHPTGGGVRATRGGKTLVELKCRQGTAQVTPFAITDGFEQAGFCWDFETQQFRRGCRK